MALPKEQESSSRSRLHKHHRKMPSFSSSLLDAIYHSFDHHHPPPPLRRYADDDIQTLRRTIMIDKWMDHRVATTTSVAATRHLPSNSASSTDSSIFTSSSETDSSTPKPQFPVGTKKPDRENRFSRTKSRALKIYGDLKKVKEPISPGGKISNFFNSIFSPRSSFKIKEEWAPVTKSRSMKDPTSSSRSCLTKNSTTNSSKSTITNKSKRSVRFCPVNVILDQHSKPTRATTTAASSTMAEINVGSRFIKKNMDTIRLYENNDACCRDFDDKSCASSDLFELENIGRGGDYDAELPVYGTTDLRFL